jgi:hypothetical protein
MLVALLLSSTPVEIRGSVHEMIAIKIHLQLVWHFSDISPLAFESWILETHSLEGMGLVHSWYQQYSLCFHLLADTRRTMLYLNQDKQLKHYGKVPQSTHPLSFLLACYKIGQSGLGSKIGDSPGFFNSTNKVVVLWDPGGVKPLTIRLVLLLPCSPCWCYKNSNRCCITYSSNYWSSWVLVLCQNINSITSCFLNASMQQIFLQDNEAKVQGS